MTTAKFNNSAVTEFLWQMAVNGWFTDIAEDPDGSGEFVAWTWVMPTEAGEVLAAFEGQHGVLDLVVAPSDIVGGWTIRQEADGSVYKVKWPTRFRAREAFRNFLADRGWNDVIPGVPAD